MIFGNYHWIYGEVYEVVKHPCDCEIYAQERLIYFNDNRVFIFIKIHQKIPDVDPRNHEIVIKHGEEYFYVEYIRDMFQKEIDHVKEVGSNEFIWKCEDDGYEKI